jgi:hypothetical protein
MKFSTSDPDLSTIANRIRGKLYDLQPDFQRGEVWGPAKKQRLIDSILRGWHIPPVHLVKKVDGRFDVLDGQQRLTAIRDFMQGAFAVGRQIEPIDPSIESLAGLRYEQLPDRVRNDFDMFTIRVLTLDDYGPAEPHELFFRLNQPTSLTEAEKRNALMGGPRDQVKELVAWASGRGLDPAVIGFSNARMAYDDLLARFLMTLESGALNEKVTAARITDRYRDPRPFSKGMLEVAHHAIDFVLRLPVLHDGAVGVKPNKATVHTWFCLAAEAATRGALDTHEAPLAEGISWIESRRFLKSPTDEPDVNVLLSVFHDRATSRVADVSSVILRDMCAWMLLIATDEGAVPHIDIAAQARQALREMTDAPRPIEALNNFAQKSGWGTGQWI